MATSRSRPVSARFDQFEVDFTCNELRNSGVRVPVQEKPFQLLRLLLESEGRAVKRDQLRDALWPADTFVDFEHGVNVAIRKLRHALGDTPDNPKFIETLPKLGYRFIVPVEWVPEACGTEGLHIVVPIDRSGPEPEPSTKESPKRHRLLLATIAVIALAVAVALTYPGLKALVEKQNRIGQLQRMKVVPLTSLPGLVCATTFSPDGSQVAFNWDGGNADWNLYVKVIGNEKTLRISHLRQWFGGMSWSPDGQSIAVVKTTPELSGVYLVSPIGGAERKVANRRGGWFDNGNEVSWSPDGKKLAMLDDVGDSPSIQSVQLFMLSLNTLERTPVRTGCNVVATPAFSPDGDYLAWVCVDNGSSNSIHILRLKDGKSTELLRQADSIGGIAWARDSKRIVFSSPWRIGDLWEISLDQPNLAQRLPFGHDAFHVAISPARNRLAYAQMHANTNIYRANLLGLDAPPQKVVTSSREQVSPSVSPDGTHIAFQSNRSGRDEIWVSDADGSNAKQLSSFGILTTGNPRWSPDGKLIAFDSRAGGEANIYLVDPLGGVPRKLDIDIHGNSQPEWSHDGKWLYFDNGEDARSPSVWKVSSGGGHAIQIARSEAFIPRESPDGKYVYFNRKGQLWRVQPDGAAEEKVTGMPGLGGSGEAWFPASLGIYFMNWDKPKPEIDFFDLTTRQVSTIVAVGTYPPEWSGSLPVSSDGKWLYFSQVDEYSSDLMLVENWQ